MAQERGDGWRALPVVARAASLLARIRDNFSRRLHPRAGGQYRTDADRISAGCCMGTALLSFRVQHQFGLGGWILGQHRVESKQRRSSVARKDRRDRVCFRHDDVAVGYRIQPGRTRDLVLACAGRRLSGVVGDLYLSLCIGDSFSASVDSRQIASCF